MGVAKIRVRALVVSINAGGLFANCSSEASSRFQPMGFAEVRVGALAVPINGVCQGSSEGSRGFDDGIV